MVGDTVSFCNRVSSNIEYCNSHPVIYTSIIIRSPYCPHNDAESMNTCCLDYLFIYDRLPLAGFLAIIIFCASNSNCLSASYWRSFVSTFSFPYVWIFISEVLLTKMFKIMKIKKYGFKEMLQKVQTISNISTKEEEHSVARIILIKFFLQYPC